jgi:tetratricopeptide (TPR) repeat protein
MIDDLKDAVTAGGASRITIKHNGNVVWETHVTSALLDDLARWLVGPLQALLKLLGGDEQFQIEVADELMEQYNRANALYDEGKLEEAKTAYKKCIDRDKYFAPAHLSLGAVYEAQHDIPVATKCYTNAVKIDPTGEAGRFARENLRRLRGY